MTVEATTVGGGEDRADAALADGEVHGPGSSRRQGDGDGLAALAQHDEGPMSSLHPEGLDVGPEGL